MRLQYAWGHQIKTTKDWKKFGLNPDFCHNIHIVGLDTGEHCVTPLG